MTFGFDLIGLAVMVGVLIIGIAIGKMWGHKTALTSFINEQNRLKATEIWAARIKRFQDMEVSNES